MESRQKPQKVQNGCPFVILKKFDEQVTINLKPPIAERNIQRTASHLRQERKNSKKTHLSKQNPQGQTPITSRNSGSRV